MVWKFNAPGAASGAQPALAPAPTNAAPPPPAAAPAAPAPAAIAAPAAAAAPALPAVSPPLEFTPTATAPAAPAPARRRTRSAAAAATPAPVAQVAGQQTLAAAIQPVAAPAAVAAPQASAVPVVSSVPAVGFLATLIPQSPTGKSGLSVIVEGQTAAGEPNIFPTLFLTGGPQGGMFDNDEMNEEGSDNDLPVGRKAIGAVLLGFRTIVVSWPEAFKEGSKPQRPKWQGSVPATDAETTDIVQQACQRYTFRNRDLNANYDQYGHPAPTLEMLVFEPAAGIFCIRTTGTYDSMLETSKTAVSVFPEGRIQPVPVLITPVTETRSSKKKTWNEHYLRVQQHVDPALIAAFNAFFQQAGNDPDLNTAVAEWSEMTLTPDQIESLRSVTRLG